MSVGGFHLDEATNPTGRPWATSLKYTSSSSARCTVKPPEAREARPDDPWPLSAMAGHRRSGRGRVQRELGRELPHLAPNPRDRVVILLHEHLVDEVGHLEHLGLREAAGRDGRRPDPDAAGHERGLRVARDGVLVDRDPG